LRFFQQNLERSIQIQLADAAAYNDKMKLAQGADSEPKFFGYLAISARALPLIAKLPIYRHFESANYKVALGPSLRRPRCVRHDLQRSNGLSKVPTQSTGLVVWKASNIRAAALLSHNETISRPEDQGTSVQVRQPI
jgi:hypothetical protein